jgi:hypothetical protein
MDVATPASSGGTESSSAPLTFQQAFAADASPASSTPTPDSTTPPAAAQPGEGAGTPPADKREPFIPRDRFDEVNTQLGELKTWKEQYGWAAQIPQADLQEAIRIAQLSKADPIAYVQSYISELQSHPTYGAQLKSLAARALAQRSQPAAASPDLTPISVQLDNGQTVPLYSADQIAALKSQWLAEAEAKFQPVTQTVEQLQAARAAETEQVQSQTFAAQVYTQVKQWPGVDDAAMKAMAEVVARDATLPQKPTFAELELAVHRAYQSAVLPSLSQKAEAKLLDSLKTKAAASTSVNPGSTATASPAQARSFYDPALRWK